MSPSGHIRKRERTPVSEQRSKLEALFRRPDREVVIPKDIDPLKALSPPPDFVAHVHGSSAGAGSGEFHVYKNSRRREAERMKALELASEKQAAQESLEKMRAEMNLQDELKTVKNREKRRKRQAKIKELAKRNAKTTDDTSQN